MADTPAITFPQIDFTNRDYTTVKQALVDFVTVRLPNDFTDFTESQLGIFLLELNAYICDILGFQLDYDSNEVYIQTVRQRANLLNIVKLLGFKPAAATAASVTLTVNNPVAFPLDCTIPAGTKITVGSIIFELLQPYVIPAGIAFVLNGPTIVQGASFSENFTADGSQFQKYKSSQGPVIANSVVVLVNGFLQTQVDALIFAQATPSYVLTFDADGNAIIEFGDGTNGLVPPNGSIVSLSYRVGGGSIGNIAVGAIRTSVPAKLSNGSPVSVFVENRRVGSGGSDEDSNDRIKFLAPQLVREHGNAVTQNDYDTLASSFSDPTFGQIAKAITVPRKGQTNSSGNEIDIYVWVNGPSGLTTASQGLKEALLAFLNTVRIITIDIFIQDGGLTPIDLNIDVTAVPTFQDPVALQATIVAAVKAFFNQTSIAPGDPFHVSQVYDIVQNIPGVFTSRITDPVTGKLKDDVSVIPNSIFIQGTVNVTVSIPGATKNSSILVVP